MTQITFSRWFDLCYSLPLATATASMRSLYLTIALYILLACPVSSSTSSSSSSLPETSIPWHATDSRSSILEELNYSDMPPTIFSPTGRLHPVERVLAASKLDQPRANLVIAVTCNKGVVILSTLTTCAHLNTTTSLFVPSSIAPIFELSPQIVAVAAGNAVDGQVLKLKVQRLAEKIIEAQGDDENLRASELSRRLADMLQVATQTVGGKGGPMLASSALIVGQSQLWRIDPTGQFWNCHATALGRAADKAQEELYQQLLEVCGGSPDNLVDYLQTWSSDDAIQLVSKCMEKVLFPKAQQIMTTAASPTEAARLMPKIHWQGVVVDYSSSMRKPKKTTMRGAFLPPGSQER